MKRLWLPVLVGLAIGALPAAALGAECELTPRTACFGLEDVEAALSTTQAGAHPDLDFSFEMKLDPQSDPNVFGLRNSFATPRTIRFELPPGMIGNPNVLGASQQCTVAELVGFTDGIACPNSSQVGISTIYAYQLTDVFVEPVYMMEPPGGEVVARLGMIAGVYPTFIDIRVRSESDYGLIAEVTDAPVAARLVKLETTTWGVPTASSHDTERCTPEEAFNGCEESPARPPGSRPLPFMTNPTRCGVPLKMEVAAASWDAPGVFDSEAATFPQISGCNRLPFGPSLNLAPTSRRAGAPTGLDVTVRQPGAEGVDVLEPSHIRHVKVTLPQGLALNPGAADGLATCSQQQVRFGERVFAECPEAAKVATAEFDIPALPRRMEGAVYLREPAPGDSFRIWLVADDLGAHVKLPGQLLVDKADGRVRSIFLDLPQAPIREAKLVFKSGVRAPLVNPPTCGTHATAYEFTPWSRGPVAAGPSAMAITENCEGLGGFSPSLRAGTEDPTAGQHSPFLFTLTRRDGEQNPAAIELTLPRGLAATFAGVDRCERAAAETGQCPADSRIGKAITAVGYGAAPLWVPQPGKRATAVYLGGPYKGAPFSVVTVVPAQAGPFDFGDEVVRSALYVDPVLARGVAVSDALPQIIEGIPIRYRSIQVHLDRPGFTLNPTGCGKKRIEATVRATEGGIATPSAPFHAANCDDLPFKPKFSFRLFGDPHRGAFPKLRVALRARRGDANISRATAVLPDSLFLEQGHIGTVCTRVQFGQDRCPSGSVYGQAVARTSLLEKPLKGPVYLRSSSNPLPDLVVALDGELEIELVGRIDSVDGAVRTTFDMVPDAPVTRFVLTMKGGNKGLLVNSQNICRTPAFAEMKLRAHNDRIARLHPQVRASCGS